MHVYHVKIVLLQKNDDLSMISLIAKLMSLVLLRAALSKCSSLLGNISLSVLRLQSGCTLAVLATSVCWLMYLQRTDSMDGRSPSESSSKTLDNFALFIRFTCTCSTMSSSLFSSLERVDSGFDSMNLSKVG